MDPAELDKFLAPISEDEPCGPDLEYDADFGEMERAAQDKPEQQFGDTIVPAEPPDWKDVKKKAEALLDRTKDMRVAVVWARASLHQSGLTGFENALAVLRGYVEDFWETVHPELDADDDDDPTYRTNTLVTLCDEETLLRELREAPLVSSRAMGRFGLREIEIARDPGESKESSEAKEGGAWAEEEPSDSPPEESGPTLAAIEAAFTDADLDEIQATEEATRLAAEHVAAIDQFVTEKVGAARAVSLKSTRDLLHEMNQAVVEQLNRRGVSAGPIDAEESLLAEVQEIAGVVAEGGQAIQSTSVVTGNGFAPGTRIQTRQQAIAALEQICEYYQNSEPSSPLPILLLRAKRLATMSFMDILMDMAPGAVSHAEALSGGSAVVMDYANASSGSEESENSSQAEEEEAESSDW